MELRPYQEQAIAAVESAFSTVRSTLIVMATGTGKTVVMAKLAAREVRRGGRVLLLAHRGELLTQAIDKIRKATKIEAGLEKADVVAVDDEFPYTIIVGSVQSMCRPKRLARFRRDEFSLIMIDECHHALTNTYSTIIDHFNKANLLGVTATPDRGDQRSLGSVFQTIAFEYDMIRAINDGYLCPIVAQTVPLKIDLSAVAQQAGDFQTSSLGSALDPYLKQICAEIKARCRERKTIVFTPLIATSLKMVQFFREAGIENVREVNGESANRKELLDWFANAPKGSVMVNSMLLTEGYDEPSTDCIVVLRATQVRALYVQMVGRGTRLSPGKTNLLLLDFLWMTARHNLCRPASLLTEDPEVAQTITKKQEKKTGAEETLEISAEELGIAVSETVKKREDSLAQKLEAQKRKKGGLIDPLKYAKDIGSFSLQNQIPAQLDESNRPTMEQFDKLEKLGFACPGSFTAAQAVLDAYSARSESGLSSPKQIRLLKRMGFQRVETWTFAQAKKLVDRISASGWRVPHTINPKTYQPN